MKTTLLALVFLLVTGIAEAQDQKTADKKFWAVGTFLVGSTIYDVESTYYALDKCPTCRERNPFMRPFVKAGKPWLYTVQGSIDAGVIYASYKTKKQAKKLWWLLPVVMTATHSIAGTNNIRIAIRF